jgi:hypothetical protein
VEELLYDRFEFIEQMFFQNDVFILQEVVSEHEIIQFLLRTDLEASRNFF